jgi:hypothetical protein
MILADMKAAIAVGLTTAASGASWAIGLIPDDLGGVATVAGLLLTFFTIRVKVAERRKLELEIKRLEGDV